MLKHKRYIVMALPQRSENNECLKIILTHSVARRQLESITSEEHVYLFNIKLIIYKYALQIYNILVQQYVAITST